MKKTTPKVLVVATSRKTRGGITSVIKAHETGEQWKKYNCKWIETHRDGNSLRKIYLLIFALIQYFFLLPFYNIVHIHLATGKSSALRKLLFIILAKIYRKKIIIHFHPSNIEYLHKNKNLFRKIFLSANLTIVLSNFWKNSINDILKVNNKVLVLYNPCLKVNRHIQIKEKYILVAGTIIPRKGYETIIIGFSLISTKFPDWKIVFAGNGEIEKALEITKKYKIEKQVEFIGWVDGKDKENVFQKASIYCLASVGEGFPMGVLDAWAYGLPCVVTPVGGLPDLVVNNKSGLFFPIGESKSLSIQLEKIIRDEILRNNIISETDKIINEVLEINIINLKLDSIYNNLFYEDEAQNID